MPQSKRPNRTIRRNSIVTERPPAQARRYPPARVPDRHVGWSRLEAYTHAVSRLRDTREEVERRPDRSLDERFSLLFPCRRDSKGDRAMPSFPCGGQPSGQRVSTASEELLTTVRSVLMEKGGASFSVFVPVISGDEPLGAPEGMPYVVKDLQSLFSQENTTWVVHVPRDLPSSGAERLANVSSWSDNVVWTHRRLDDWTLDMLTLIPYMFDFMLLPQSSLRVLMAGNGSSTARARHRLASLLSIAKVSLIVPAGGRLACAAERDLTFTPSTLERPTPWVEELKFSSELVPVDGRPECAIESVSVEAVTRYTLHHFFDKPRALPRAYRFEFMAHRSWIPTLTVYNKRTRLRQGLSGSLTAMNGSIDGQPLSPDTGTAYPIVFDSNRERSRRFALIGHAYEPSTRVIRLTQLANVNLQLIAGLEPSTWGRLLMWKRVLELRSFFDCLLANVCLLGTRATWCDSHVTSQKLVGKSFLGEDTSSLGSRCTWKLGNALLRCSTCRGRY